MSSTSSPRKARKRRLNQVFRGVGLMLPLVWTKGTKASGNLSGERAHGCAPLPRMFQEPLDLIVRADQEEFQHVVGRAAKQDAVVNAGARFPYPVL